MAIQLDEDGELDLTVLTEEDIREISDKVVKGLESADEAWSEKYGPFESVSLAELGQEALQAKLDAVDDSLIWVHNDVDGGIVTTPFEGLELRGNGDGWELGRYHYGGTEEIYAISKTPCLADDSGPVFTYFSCRCPFCEDGEFKGEECSICFGSGSWDIEI
jgi:hypothetical protein